jgi:acyl-CoA oxidase
MQGNGPANDTTRIFTAYLQKQDIGAAHDILGSDSDLVDAFAWRTSFLTFEALKHRDVEKSSWNSLLIDFWRLSTAHSQYLVVKNFYDAIKSESIRYELDPVTIEVLHKLFRLYALNTLEKVRSSQNPKCLGLDVF